MCNYKTNLPNLKNYECPHPIYNNSQYCVFHFGLKDNDSKEINEEEVNKKEDDFKKALKIYLEKKEYDFICWVFPNIDFNDFKKQNDNNFVFIHAVRFSKTIFSKQIIFANVIFAQDVYFINANFNQVVYFNNANFMDFADFNNANFMDFADFGKTIFENNAIFRHASFANDVYFENTSFTKEANFREVNFEKSAYFRKASFSSVAFFLKANFANVADFAETIIENDAVFRGANFATEARFNFTLFLGNIDISYSTCKGNVYIYNSYITSLKLDFLKSDSLFFIANSCIKKISINYGKFETIKFNNVLTYLNNTELEKKMEEYNNKVEEQFKINIAKLKEEKNLDNEWNFSSQDLSNYSFIETDLRVANFLSANIQKTHFDNCIFEKDKTGRIKLYTPKNDTDVMVDKKTQKELNKKMQFVYQRFKRQFTENHYYQLAQDFHFQEMNIRRKITPKIIEKFFLFFYFIFSKYGTNYILSLGWLALWIVIFPILLLIKTWDFNFHNIDFKLYPDMLSSLFKLIAPLKLIHNDDEVFKNIYKDYINTGWGMTFVIIYYIFVTIFITLFIQALSRNFKR